jgi:zinc-finger of the FCS-type, C2-C2
VATSPNRFQSLHPPLRMLSSKKSIFHVGEEGRDNIAIRIHAKNILVHRIKGVIGQVRLPVEGHVGLRIVIQQHMHGSNIVLKPMVNPCKFKELLKACYLCKKVLSHNMDVYMYRYICHPD